jgi:hypothetical protein
MASLMALHASTRVVVVLEVVPIRFAALDPQLRTVSCTWKGRDGVGDDDEERGWTRMKLTIMIWSGSDGCGRSWRWSWVLLDEDEEVTVMINELFMKRNRIKISAD